jgi:hypothetical protein
VQQTIALALALDPLRRAGPHVDLLVKMARVPVRAQDMLLLLLLQRDASELHPQHTR